MCCATSCDGPADVDRSSLSKKTSCIDIVLEACFHQVRVSVLFLLLFFLASKLVLVSHYQVIYFLCQQVIIPDDTICVHFY